jgi:adenosylhomocysteine nucleosidase
MDTADILFIAADPREFAGAMRFWSEIRPAELPVHWARSAIWKNKRILAIANGAGPHRSAAAERVASYRLLVNMGFCGALDPKLRIGDIVVGDRWLKPRTSSSYVPGPIASVEYIAQTAVEKRRLRDTGAIAVEMESAGLEKLPFYCIKSVSDLADESFANDLNGVLQPDGRASVSKLLFHACLRPFSRIPELRRLQRNAGIASNSLGEFLESCEF